MNLYKKLMFVFVLTIQTVISFLCCVSFPFQIMEEFRWTVEMDNIDFLKERERWESFYSKVQYYGVVNRVLKPLPPTMNSGELYGVVGLAMGILSSVFISHIWLYFSHILFSFYLVEHAIAIFAAAVSIKLEDTQPNWGNIPRF